MELHKDDQAGGTSQSEELTNLQNEISNLRQSIDTVESELLRVSIRKEFLGRDADGRLYWIFGRQGSSPHVLVNTNPEEMSTLWVSYNLNNEIKELVKWLNDDDTREKDLKDTILQWLSQKFVSSPIPTETNSDIFNIEEEPDTVQSTNKPDLVTDYLITKAFKALEKKFGDFIGIQKARCECLELIWPSRPNCLSCHVVSFSDNTEFTEHEKCLVLSSVPEHDQTAGDSSKHSNMPMNQSNHVENIPKTDYPFNFKEIRMKLKTDTSLLEVVKDIGLIRSNGVVPFVPNRLYTDDHALILTQIEDISLPSCSEDNDKVTEVAKAKGLKLSLSNERGCDLSDPSLVFSVSLNSLVREPSLRPKIGKGFEILPFLKINLLDMDAALPDEALRSSRSSIER